MIINGFRKTGVYQLNKDAIISPAKSSVTKSMFTSAQLLRFEERYGNGYDIFVDKDYVKWLSLYHPKALPDDLGDDVVQPLEINTSSPNDSVTTDSSNTSNPDGKSHQLTSEQSLALLEKVKKKKKGEKRKKQKTKARVRRKEAEG